MRRGKDLTCKSVFPQSVPQRSVGGFLPISAGQAINLHFLLPDPVEPPASDSFVRVHPVEKILRLTQHGLTPVRVHPVKGPIHLRHARIALEPVSVTVHEMPV